MLDTELSMNVAGSLQDARRILKTWVLMGAQYSSRAEHMHKSVKDLLMDALHQQTLLAESDLDKLLSDGELLRLKKL